MVPLHNNAPVAHITVDLWFLCEKPHGCASLYTVFVQLGPIRLLIFKTKITDKWIKMYINRWNKENPLTELNTIPETAFSHGNTIGKCINQAKEYFEDFKS